MKKVLVVLCGLAFFAFTACGPKGPTPEQLQKEQDSLAQIKADSMVKADSIAKAEVAAKAEIAAKAIADSLAKIEAAKPKTKVNKPKPVKPVIVPVKEEPKKKGGKPGAKN